VAESFWSPNGFERKGKKNSHHGRKTRVTNPKKKRGGKVREIGKKVPILWGGDPVGVGEFPQPWGKKAPPSVRTTKKKPRVKQNKRPETKMVAKFVTNVLDPWERRRKTRVGTHTPKVTPIGYRGEGKLVFGGAVHQTQKSNRGGEGPQNRTTKGTELEKVGR